MKNNDYSFRAFLQELATKRDVQVFAVKSMIFLFSVFFGYALVIALYNILNTPV